MKSFVIVQVEKELKSGLRIRERKRSRKIKWRRDYWKINQDTLHGAQDGDWNSWWLPGYHQEVWVVARIQKNYGLCKLIFKETEEKDFERIYTAINF